VSTDQKPQSRREFCPPRRLAVLAAPIAAPLAAAIPLARSRRFPASRRPATSQLPPNFPKLSDQSRAEVEARYESIVKQYGGRFNDQPESRAAPPVLSRSPALDNLRAYTIHNGDSPALYLKPLVEREKKPPKPASPSPAAAAKKP